MIIPSPRWRPALAMAIAAGVGGAIVAVHYFRLGLTLSHYDARGHLVVARRIVDSITPGWQQIGAVWLPLPHLLNFLPAQIDVFFETGVSAVAFSVVAFAMATGAIAWIVHALTQSRIAALMAAAVFGFNPNVLYLQATPMTEPLLLALVLTAFALLIEWTSQGSPAVAEGMTAARDSAATRWTPATIGWVFALACLTRYEAWPAAACAIGAAVWVRWRQGESIGRAGRSVAAIAVYPAVAIGGFLIFSRVVVGEWFTASGFFVPENKALGNPIAALAEIWWGVRMLSGRMTAALAVAGLLALLVRGVASRRHAQSLVPLSLLASAALPWAAFVEGHPFRIRYMVPLIAAEAIGVGAAAGFLKRGVLVTAALVAALAVAFEIRPLDLSAPMIVEAQWDRPNVPLRHRVTRYLRDNYDGEKIMASMGSLGHYMQETARDGFRLRDFLHEGNGDIWLWALESPRRYAGWILIEEKAEGGDMLAKIARENPGFLAGYDPVCEGAGLVLYRRSASSPRP